MPRELLPKVVTLVVLTVLQGCAMLCRCAANVLLVAARRIRDRPRGAQARLPLQAPEERAAPLSPPPSSLHATDASHTRPPPTPSNAQDVSIGTSEGARRHQQKPRRLVKSPNATPVLPPPPPPPSWTTMSSQHPNVPHTNGRPYLPQKGCTKIAQIPLTTFAITTTTRECERRMASAGTPTTPLHCIALLRPARIHKKENNLSWYACTASPAQQQDDDDDDGFVDMLRIRCRCCHSRRSHIVSSRKAQPPSTISHAKCPFHLCDGSGFRHIFPPRFSKKPSPQ